MGWYLCHQGCQGFVTTMLSLGGEIWNGKINILLLLLYILLYSYKQKNYKLFAALTTMMCLKIPEHHQSHLVRDSARTPLQYQPSATQTGGRWQFFHLWCLGWIERGSVQAALPRLEASSFPGFREKPTTKPRLMCSLYTKLQFSSGQSGMSKVKESHFEQVKNTVYFPCYKLKIQTSLKNLISINILSYKTLLGKEWKVILALKKTNKQTKTFSPTNMSPQGWDCNL